jgi:hypothetical protein
MTMEINDISYLAKMKVFNYDPKISLDDYQRSSELTLITDDVNTSSGDSTSAPRKNEKSNKPKTRQKRSSNNKPGVSYSRLISSAISNSEKLKVTLNEIYTYALENYPYFRTAGNGWKVFLLFI